MTTATHFDAHEYVDACGCYVRNFALAWEAEARRPGTPTNPWARNADEISAELARLEEAKAPHGDTLRALAIYAVSFRWIEGEKEKQAELRYLRGRTQGMSKCDFCVNIHSAAIALDDEVKERMYGMDDPEVEFHLEKEFFYGRLDAEARERIDRDGCGYGEFFRQKSALLCLGFEEDTPAIKRELIGSRERQRGVESLRERSAKKLPECSREFLLDNLVRHRLGSAHDKEADLWLANFLGHVLLDRVAADAEGERE